MKSKNSKLLATLCALTLLVGTAHGATITITVSADTHIRSGSAYVNSPQETAANMLVGSFSGPTYSRALLSFDTSALDAMGTVDISSVTLIGKNASATGAGGSLNLSVHEYAYDLDAAAATWNNPDGLTGGDSTAGGTFSTVVATIGNHSVNANVSATFSSTAAFVIAVENALGGDNTLNLLIKQSTEENANRYTRFANDDSAEADRFKLVIEYTVVPEPRAALLGGLGILMLLRRRR